MMGVTVRFMKGVILEAAGTQTECGGKRALCSLLLALGQAARVIYMCYMQGGVLR